VPCVYLLYHEIRPFPVQYSYAIERSVFEAHVGTVALAPTDPTRNARAEFTFDDGFASDFDYALPILNSHGLRGHFFITPGWTGHRKGYIGWQQLKAICDAGHIIGAHGWSHTLLTHCSPSELDRELRLSRETLEDKLGVAITSISFPGGRYNRRVLAACRKAGYMRVFTSEPRIETTTSGFTVGRINVSADRPPKWIRALLQPHSTELATLRREYWIKRSVKGILGDWVYERIWNAVRGSTRVRQAGTTVAHENTASHQ
jgi:peptidoglycan/xylan/chitin deacetylase (PgdA/CDA1 family)